MSTLNTLAHRERERNHKSRPAPSLWSATPPANGALGAGEAKATRDGLHASNPPGCGFLANTETNDGRKEKKTAGADRREQSPDDQSLIPSQDASETGVWMRVCVHSAAGDSIGVKSLLLLVRNGAGMAS